MDCSSLYQKVRARKRLSLSEARFLYEHADLLKLGALANEIAREKNGQEVGFIIDRNINYTNICALSCTFCNFYRKKQDRDAHTLSFAELDQKIKETIALGGTGILMQGGHHPDYKLPWYEDLFHHIRATFPALHIHALSPPEIKHIANISRTSFRETLTRLKQAGLQSIPGGGGEILVDRVRKIISRGKVLSDEWLEISEMAHAVGLPTSATMMFGHIETTEERLLHLEQIRNSQDRTGGYFSFIPWTFQAEDTELGQTTAIKPVNGHEYLRLLAIARITLDNFKNIQASWLTQGVKLAQVALHFGANDLGSVMIEENVISQAGAHHQATSQVLQEAIARAGFVPKQRSTCYNFLEAPPASAA